MILRACGVVMILAAALAWVAPVTAQPKELPATVVTLTGKAEWFKKGDTKWNAADLRDQVTEGDGVRTGPGVRAALRTVGGNAIRLAALTQVFFVPPPPGGLDPNRCACASTAAGCGLR